MKKPLLSVATVALLVILSAANAHAIPRVPDTATTSLLLGPVVLAFGLARRFFRR